VKGDLSINGEHLHEFVRGIDVVIHCAGELINENEFIETNYQGTRHLFSAAQKEGVSRFIHLSSVGVYGRLDFGSVDETAELVAMNSYEYSKILADRWLLSQESDMDLVIMRPSIVFGCDMPNQSLKQWVKAIKQGSFVFFGSKEASVNYLHVDDLVSALYLLAVEELVERKQIFNLSDCISVEELVEIVCNVMECRCPKVRLPLLLVKGGGYFFDLLSKMIGVKFPLSVSRVNALSSHVSYNSSRLFSNTNYVLKCSLKERLIQVLLHWKKDGI